MTLTESKEVSVILTEEKQKSAATEAEIEQASLMYLPLANGAVNLFFCVVQLGSINAMYQYSLESFKRKLSACIQDVSVSEERLEAIALNFQKRVHSFVSRGLFEKDRFAFTVNLLLQKLWSPHDQI